MTVATFYHSRTAATILGIGFALWGGVIMWFVLGRYGAWQPLAIIIGTGFGAFAFSIASKYGIRVGGYGDHSGDCGPVGDDGDGGADGGGGDGGGD